MLQSVLSYSNIYNLEDVMGLKKASSNVLLLIIFKIIF